MEESEDRVEGTEEDQSEDNEPSLRDTLDDSIMEAAENGEAGDLVDEQDVPEKSDSDTEPDSDTADTDTTEPDTDTDGADDPVKG